MARINTGKVIVGSIAAGVVINIVETTMDLFVLGGTNGGIPRLLEPAGTGRGRDGRIHRPRILSRS